MVTYSSFVGEGDLRVGDVSFFLGLVALDATTALLFVVVLSTLDLLFMLANDDGGVFTSRLSLKS